MATTTSRPKLVTSSFLLSNMHCPSCVSHIQDTLYELNPRPLSVAPSLVSSVVTVEHDKSLSVRNIYDALESAGFGICDVTAGPGNGQIAVSPSYANPNGEIGYLDLFFQKLSKDPQNPSSIDTELRKRHVENCESCRLEHECYGDQVLDSKSPRPSPGRPKKGQNAMRIEEAPIQPLVVIDTDSQTTWRATLAIGKFKCP
jgi:copper chaperone CopZ